MHLIPSVELESFRILIRATCNYTCTINPSFTSKPSLTAKCSDDVVSLRRFGAEPNNDVSLKRLV